MASITFLALLPAAFAYPWVARAPGVDSSLLSSRTVRSHPIQIQQRDSAQCPNNPNHQPAAPITSQYPYLGAINGQPGTGKGGILVPADGDTAHYYQAPDYSVDIRGPCPGINTMANHGFLARDGITTFNELVDAQQNVFNVGYDLAVVLAVAGVGLDGDLVGTGKLSIGCDATSRTAAATSLLADELGLDGHNHFEADASLTRNDYFLANGDNYRWNATLFTEMISYCTNGGTVNCDVNALSKYRAQRWQESEATNGNFFFSPGSLLLYGAASFLYELFPTNGGSADEATMMSFFGANKTDDGTYVYNGGERIPDNWFSRSDPYDNVKVGLQIDEMYLLNPVQFGGNVGPNNFQGMNFSTYVTNGQLNVTPQDGSYFMCMIYQSLTGGFPAELGKTLDIPVALNNAIIAKLNPMFQNFGCPLNHNSGSSVSGS